MPCNALTPLAYRDNLSQNGHAEQLIGVRRINPSQPHEVLVGEV